MIGFDALAGELDRWDALGRHATLWLRDDDACSDSPALRRLLGLAGEHRVPVAIAAIPAAVDSTLGDAIGDCGEATLVQHGYAHRNHARMDQRSAELGDDRSVRTRLDELERGRNRLADAFGARFRPVLVPPWNRIGADIVAHLRAAGFAGLSRFGPRDAREAAAGLTQVNAHVDPIAWRRERAFIGADAALARLTAHLGERRQRVCDADEPTGILTHHLAFPDAAWDFVAELLRRTRGHRAAQWLDVDRAFDWQPAQATSCRST